MSDAGPTPAVWPTQSVLRVHHGVLIDTPLVPTWGSAAWAAVVWRDDRAPGGWARATMAPGPGGRGYDTSGITPGDVVEFGADYRHQTGRTTFEMIPRRWYGVVLATHPEHLVALGPWSTPEPARRCAERALAVWRQSVQVDIPGITDVATTAALALPLETTPSAPRPAEIRTDGHTTTTTVDDPTHGRLLVDTAVFSAAMGRDTDELHGWLADAHANSGQPVLTGAEPKVTLAALTAVHAPEPLAPDPAAAGTAPIPGVAASGRDTTYYGHPDGSVERVDHTGGRALRAPMRWTPDGFSWGYHGDGPTELAYALLADATGSTDTAARLAGRYADTVVAHLPQGEAWSLPGNSVTSWAARAEQQQEPIPAASRAVRNRERDVGL